jgi:hypothetical protein
MWRKRNLNDKMAKDLQQLAESYCIYDWNSRCLRSFDVDEVRQIQLNIMYTKKTLYEFGIESKILNESEELIDNRLDELIEMKKMWKTMDVIEQ